MTHSRTRPKGALARCESELRGFALGFPGVTEDFPWGHRAFKVNKKAFVFMSAEDGRLSLSVKLPASHGMALMLPFAEPTGYGLGKSGWITATFATGAEVPIPILRAWFVESYRAIAPKKLAAQLEASGANAASAPAVAARRAPAKQARKKPPARMKPAAERPAARTGRRS